MCQQKYANTNDLENNKKIVEFILKYAKENIAMVRLFVRDPYYTSIKRDVEMTLSSFWVMLEALLVYLWDLVWSALLKGFIILSTFSLIVVVVASIKSLMYLLQPIYQCVKIYK